MPTVTFKTLLKFLRPSRKDPSTTLRKQICDDQKGKCAKCGSACKLEIDHIHKISTDPLNRNGRDNRQGLCAECHQAKTLAQTSDVEYNPMMSYFNDHTWSNFVMSERPKQQMYRSTTIDERIHCQQVDVIRCRRNILAHSSYPWYVFSIWDDIKSRDNYELASFNFVSKRAPRNATEMMKEAPHVGPSWRSKEVCAFLLNEGIISWSDITHQLNATCELPSDFFTEALEKIEETWDSTSAPQ